MKNCKSYFFTTKRYMLATFTQIDLFSSFFRKRLSNSVVCITSVVKKCRISIKSVVAVPTLLAVSRFM